ncbi:uncharacterized protein LOC114543257 isoform X2 [Dendronephthya gigantea]|uniref:uncharacterized protein LOC114543257 isoform X2 n=1 Tax=Dendronephthya gigantea TaxID=151771 RepID=UPI00106B8F51|nr:uncharacterized protein LOC114543257 isoform X2 [Dendronephthya gigantea]
MISRIYQKQRLVNVGVPFGGIKSLWRFLTDDVLPASNQYVGAVSNVDAYFSEVCRASAVAGVGQTLMAFAIQDFDRVKGTLKENCFLLVERSLHNFGGSGLGWVYRCSCDSNRSNYLLSLNVYVQGTAEELNEENKPCEHCMVVKRFIGKIEAVDGSLLEAAIGNQDDDHEYFNTDSIYELPCSRNVVCSFVHGKYSFVGSDKYVLNV